MSSVFWIFMALLVIAGCAGIGQKKGGRSPGTGKTPVRIDRPHILDPDDYECSVCHRRFRKDSAVCPSCGARFTAYIMDDEEFIEEEDELEDWEEEEEEEER